MNDRDDRPPFRKGGGKSFEKGRKFGPTPRFAPLLARPRFRRRRTGDPLWLAHGVARRWPIPARKIRKLLLTENAARRLADENIDTRVTPEIVRPQLIDQRLGPDAVHQGMLAEADPLPSPDIETLKQEGIVLVLDQITDPHNVGAILRSAAAFAVKAIVTTARHSPEATGVLAKSASGALELVPLVLVQNLARALTALNERGFLTVGLDSEGTDDLSKVALREPLALVLGAEGKGLAAIDARDLRRRGAARHARRDQEPQRVQCRGAGALCRREPAGADAANRRVSR